MPCKDITEILELKLDRNDRLIDYSLSKISCGGAVGDENLLLDKLAGKHIGELLDLTPKEFVRRFAPQENLTSFLYYKHYKALLSSIEAITGRISATAADNLAIESIQNDSSGWEIKVIIKSSLPVNNIKSCGCG